MKRLDKMALLGRVLNGTNPEIARLQLQVAMENNARGLILIDDFDDPDPGNPMGDESTVTFNDRGKEHRMTLGEAGKYAKRNFIYTLFVLPAKGVLTHHAEQRQS